MTSAPNMAISFFLLMPVESIRLRTCLIFIFTIYIYIYIFKVVNNQLNKIIKSKKKILLEPLEFKSFIIIIFRSFSSQLYLLKKKKTRRANL